MRRRWKAALMRPVMKIVRRRIKVIAVRPLILVVKPVVVGMLVVRVWLLLLRFWMIPAATPTTASAKVGWVETVRRCDVVGIGHADSYHGMNHVHDGDRKTHHGRIAVSAFGLRHSGEGYYVG